MKIDKMIRYVAGLGLVGALTFACTGTFDFKDPPGGPGPDAAPDVNPEPVTAKDYYDQNVAPIVSTAQQNRRNNASAFEAEEKPDPEGTETHRTRRTAEG